MEVENCLPVGKLAQPKAPRLADLNAVTRESSLVQTKNLNPNKNLVIKFGLLDKISSIKITVMKFNYV